MLLRAAWLYYQDGLTQADVADRLFVSRPTVGRLLERARGAGIVRVEVVAEHLAAYTLARRLQDRYGLDDAIVVPRGQLLTRERRNERLGVALASLLQRFLHPGAVVGVGWGDTVARALGALAPSSLEGVTFATVTGGIDAITSRVIGHQAIALHLRAIPAPLIVSSPQMAVALQAEPAIREVLDLASGAVVTLTGIGTALPRSSAARSGLLTEEDIEGFAAIGAVGDMLGEWFASDGRVVHGATSDRRVGISLAELSTRPNVIGVAGGAEKVPAIRGALAGGYLDLLVTDEEAADGLLADPAPLKP